MPNFLKHKFSSLVSTLKGSVLCLVGPSEEIISTYHLFLFLECAVGLRIIAFHLLLLIDEVLLVANL